MGYLDPSAGGRISQVLTGTITITDASQTESTPFALLTITPPAGVVLDDVDIMLDLAKPTTGFAAVESTATIQLRVARKLDGTNWRGEAYNEAALSGTNAAGRSQRLHIGPLGPGQAARIEAVMSADATANIQIPYALNYRGQQAPVLT